MNNALPLFSSADIEAAKALIESEGLRFEAGYDELVGVFEAGKLIGCGARQGRVLKMLVVDPDHRGGAVLGEIVTELMCDDRNVKSGANFIFAKPCAIASFERLNFRLLVKLTEAGMLESCNGLNQFLRRHASQVRTGHNGAVVINSDPFSRGHQHLIETAVAQVDNLYVFIPSEGNFTFSEDIRMELARQGTRHLSNVIVIDAGPYVLNDATFPGYFLKPGESKDPLRLEMDMGLFARHLAPYFHITTRFVGTEPLDPVARSHNQIMKQCLAEQGIRLEEIAREKVGELWINTQQVRRAFFDGDMERVREQVPATTFNVLSSLSTMPIVVNEGQAVAKEV